MNIRTNLLQLLLATYKPSSTPPRIILTHFRNIDEASVVLKEVVWVSGTKSRNTFTVLVDSWRQAKRTIIKLALAGYRDWFNNAWQKSEERIIQIKLLCCFFSILIMSIIYVIPFFKQHCEPFSTTCNTTLTTQYLPTYLTNLLRFLCGISFIDLSPSLC